MLKVGENCRADAEFYSALKFSPTFNIIYRKYRNFCKPFSVKYGDAIRMVIPEHGSLLLLPPIEYSSNGGAHGHDWQIIVQHTIMMDSRRQEFYTCCKIDQVEGLSYEAFFNKYLLPNKPCIFDSELTKLWASRRDWVTDGGKPDFSFLKQRFGSAIVPVANCGQERYSAHPKEDMKLSEYVDYWKQYTDSGYPDSESFLYLKDWHFIKAFPDYCAYTVPLYFQSDWLNEFWDTLPQDDYRFVYMGPKGTWTSFHSDVYRSHSWSANICGRKKWIFYPPGQEDHLKDRFGRHLISDVTSCDLNDKTKYPSAHMASGTRMEVEQGPGQVIFVPSGWHHQVINLEDTISINHNWLNACNIDISWRHLQSSLAEVKAEIQDLRDMDGWHKQCQMILNATAGIDYKTFINLLLVIGENRFQMIANMDSSEKSKRDLTEQPSHDCLSGTVNPDLVTSDHSPESPNITSSKQIEGDHTQDCGTDGTKLDSVRDERQCSETFQRLNISQKETNQEHDKDNPQDSVKDSILRHSSCKCKDNDDLSYEQRQKYSDTENVCCKRIQFQVADTNTGDGLDKLNNRTVTDKSNADNIRSVNLDDINDIYLLCHRLEITDPHCRHHVVFDLARVRLMLLAVMADMDYRELARCGLAQTEDELSRVVDQISKVLHVEVD